MFGSNKVQALLDVSAITTLIDTFDIGDDTYSMIVYGHVVPEEWGPQSSTINYYLSSNASGSLEYGDYTYMINCRAGTEGDAQGIAKAVYDALNRDTKSGYNVVCEIMPTIPPMDKTDNFNTIVETIIKTNGAFL